MNVVSGPACGEEDEEDVVGATVAERGEGVAAETSPEAKGEPARPGEWLGPGEVAGEREQVPAPPKKCCFVRCGAQRTYQKIPWAVEGSCDAEGWKFCEQFYVTKLADAAWLRC